MSYCLNPKCKAPENSGVESCASCGTALQLNGRYEALKPIGQGGFGRSFLAVDRSNALKPRCVIKQLYPQQMGVEGKASDLFRQEAEQLGRLGNYPSIPNFLDYFEQDGFQYLIQEFIEGRNLAEITATGELFTESDVLALLETLLETLDFLHYRNIIHRDVKPANIIETTNGRFILVDLGAAKLMTGTALGITGTVIGSAEYVAPEQLRGKAIFASDLYSLGATCIALLTGMSPFSLFDTSTGRWEWRDYVTQPVSDRLGKILDTLLEGPTKLRYASAIEVLEDLNDRSNLDKLLPFSTEKSLKSQAVQVPRFESPEASSSPHQMVIHQPGKSRYKARMLEKITMGSALVFAISCIFATLKISGLFLIIVFLSLGLRFFGASPYF